MNEGKIGDFQVTAQRNDLFARVIYRCVIGSRAYGLEGNESDTDYRGIYLPPASLHWSLYGVPDQIDREETQETVKFFALMLKKNGYVLEQLLSPLVVHTTPEHEELKALAPDCITKHHAHHYLGFAATQWKLFQKENPPHVKPLLYVYRVLLTGIHLMRTGEVEANLTRLNETTKLTYIPDLIARKVGGPELGRLEQADVEFHEREYQRLTVELVRASEHSHLPESGRATEAMNDLLVRVRCVPIT